MTSGASAWPATGATARKISPRSRQIIAHERASPRPDGASRSPGRIADMLIAPVCVQYSDVTSTSSVRRPRVRAHLTHDSR
ncbi:MAG: hypothetical protein AVDCRST_MAG93-8209 [uncultured Chloroflexia bacterium]|uniref:Uncharacterized protein n=1 Tax=uncultured Chloroflexia bacterium TaxID=1672391 RepID=A0A6J4MU11_9CHLR|nr:MAG: hypothetical protein AVDCRST_MAG93-8209 [uncultured Chloroflexia bacterium]